MKPATHPIGVFDSGVGGLTVVKELIKLLPNEDIIYFGDTARLPYGTKSRQTILRFSTENTLFLLKHKVKLVVVACNTSSSIALSALRRNFKVPVMGVIEPGAQDAAATSENKRIGIIGTQATIRSGEYEKQIAKRAPCARIFSQSCPMLVPFVEEGWLNNSITSSVISHYLKPLKTKGIDTLVLGCTHYPLLKPLIARYMGKDVALIDSAVSTAKAVKVLLLKYKLNTPSSRKAMLRFFVSDEPQQFIKTGGKFLGKPLKDVRKRTQ